MPCALPIRSEEHTSELQSHDNLVCRLLLEKKALPARSPIPLIVPWIHDAPAFTAATAHAVAIPKSLCPWKWTGMLGPTHEQTSRTSTSAASGLQAPMVSTTTISTAPAFRAA